MPTERIEFLGIGFDRLTEDEVLARLREVTDRSPYAYVVTPNVAHIVQLHEAADKADFAPSYHGANMSLCDSRVLSILARSHGLDLPVVPGSDLTVRLLHEVVRPKDKIAIIGGVDLLVADLMRLFPEVEFVHFNPPMELRRNAEARQKAADFIASAQARFALIAVGAPQQEMIAAAVLSHFGATGTALCIGASLDFITGRQRRAPRLMQRLSLEWAYRLVSDPKRLWRRYLVEGPRVLALAVHYRRRHRSAP